MSARLYLITDRTVAKRSLVEVVAAALDGIPAGSAWVQLRERDLAPPVLQAVDNQPGIGVDPTPRRVVQQHHLVGVLYRGPGGGHP